MNSRRDLQAYVDKSVSLGAPPIPDIPFIYTLAVTVQSGNPEFDVHFKFQAYHQKADEKQSVGSGVYPKGKNDPQLAVYPAQWSSKRQAIPRLGL